ncbi:MAG: acetyl-CoA carboxylase biotin carboxyl carrier protein [Victivallaceae bacterium]
MDLKQIEKLMISMGRNGIKRFVIKREGLELELERESAEKETPTYLTHYDGGVFSGFTKEQHPPVYSVNTEKPPRGNASVEESKHETGETFVTSPMVGTFYATSSPDNPPYVKSGDSVNEDTPVCIVEAMKVMNEVKAGVRGVVVEVLLTNGDPVQFGSKLFRIKVSE